MEKNCGEAPPEKWIKPDKKKREHYFKDVTLYGSPSPEDWDFCCARCYAEQTFVTSKKQPPPPHVLQGELND